MKFSGKEIVIGLILIIVVGALLFNIFWANPNNIKFCGDGECSTNEMKSCKLDCNWCGDGSCNSEECNLGCLEDCSPSQCENRICELEKGENCANTPNDCKCDEESVCDIGSEQCIYGGCGNGICEIDESYSNCPNDCKGAEYQPEDISNINYPIIFVHGHSISEQDIEYSISTFKEFQEKLASAGLYINKGIILPSTKKTDLDGGIWGKEDKPISIRTTYYAGTFDKYGSYIGPEDNQHIDTYAEKLSEIVDKTLYFTGKDKVIIVAHSMGGLVSRAYIKNKGGERYVDKLITIGTPNNGTYGYSKNLCDSLHPSPECEDMKSDSDFIKKLNSEPTQVNSLAIIGTSSKLKEAFLSCPNSESGDGVVCKSSAYLNGAKNHYYSKKDSVDGMLHGALVKPSEVLEVYEEVVNFL